MNDKTPSTQTYAALLGSIKERIQTAQVRAALSVNRELVLLYWGIGREILLRQQEEGWGKNIIPRLSKDLSSQFPDMKGLSPRNLGYMKAFAEAWPDETILQQLAAKLARPARLQRTSACSGDCGAKSPSCRETLGAGRRRVDPRTLRPGLSYEVKQLEQNGFSSSLSLLR